MNNFHYNAKHVFLGIMILSIPIAALFYRFGGMNTLRIAIFVLGIYLFAKLAVYFFTKRNPAAKAAAIALYPELIFILFLPKHLKQRLATLKEDEQSRSRGSE